MKTFFIISLAPLIASAARLSLDSAEDYLYIIPKYTNLIEGVGVGASVDYHKDRYEDICFLAEAGIERYNVFSGSTNRAPYVIGLKSTAYSVEDVVPLNLWQAITSSKIISPTAELETGTKVTEISHSQQPITIVGDAFPYAFPSNSIPAFEGFNYFDLATNSFGQSYYLMSATNLAVFCYSNIELGSRATLSKLTNLNSGTEKVTFVIQGTECYYDRANSSWVDTDIGRTVDVEDDPRGASSGFAWSHVSTVVKTTKTAWKQNEQRQWTRIGSHTQIKMQDQTPTVKGSSQFVLGWQMPCRGEQQINALNVFLVAKYHEKLYRNLARGGIEVIDEKNKVFVTRWNDGTPNGGSATVSVDYATLIETYRGQSPKPSALSISSLIGYPEESTTPGLEVSVYNEVISEMSVTIVGVVCVAEMTWNARVLDN